MKAVLVKHFPWFRKLRHLYQVESPKCYNFTKKRLKPNAFFWTHFHSINTSMNGKNRKQPIEDNMKHSFKTIKMGTALLATLTMATLSTTTKAEDDFDGLYAGVNMGYEKAKTSISSGSLSTASDGTSNLNFIVGFREQFFDSLVIGIEGSINQTKTTNTASITDALNVTTQLDYKRKNPFSLNVIAGVPVGERALLFGTLGYSKFKSTLGGTSLGSKSGYEIGAGVEVNVFGPLNVRGTIVRYNGGGLTDTNAASAFNDVKFKGKGYRLMVGAIFQF
jgi:opacity protein-like surface antigen